MTAAQSGSIVELAQGWRRLIIERKELVLARLILVQKTLRLRRDFFAFEVLPRALLKSEIFLRKTKISTLKGAPALCTFELKMRASYLVQRASELAAALERIRLAVRVGDQCASDHGLLCAKLETLRKVCFERGFAQIASEVFQTEERAKEAVICAQKERIRAQRAVLVVFLRMRVRRALLLRAKLELRLREARLLGRLRAARGGRSALEERRRRYILDEF